MTTVRQTRARRSSGAGPLRCIQLLIHEFNESRGAPAALNRALALSTGDVVVQIDGDATIETSGWIERMLAVLQLDPSVRVVTGEVVYDQGVVQACGVNLLGPDGYHDGGSLVLEPRGRRQYHQRVRRFRKGSAPSEGEAAEVDAGIAA